MFIDSHQFMGLLSAYLEFLTITVQHMAKNKTLVYMFSKNNSDAIFFPNQLILSQMEQEEIKWLSIKLYLL